MKHILFLFPFLLFGNILLAQSNNFELPVSINEDGTSPNEGSILDVQSTNKGVLFPRMTDEEIECISSPTAGLMVYDLSNLCLKIYNGTSWNCLCEADEIEAQYNEILNIKGYGGPGQDYAQDIAIDDESNLYICGNALFPFEIEGVTPSSFGDNDIFFMKFNYDGTLAWVKTFGGTDSDSASSMARDHAGNFYITGTYSGTADFGGTTFTSTGSADIPLLKLDPDGEVIWAKSYGGPNFDFARGINSDKSGNVYIVGNAGAGAQFGSIAIDTYGSGTIFLAKISEDGDVLWAKSSGGTGFDRAYAVDTDSQNNVYCAGVYSNDTIFIDNISLLPNGANDIFIAKYDENGDAVWAINPGGKKQDGVTDIIVDSANNFYISGQVTDTITFGDTTVVAREFGDVFIAKYDEDANFQWIRSSGGSTYDSGRGLTFDPDYNPIMVGSYQDTLSFDGNEVYSTSGVDPFIATFDQDGNSLSLQSYEGISSQYPTNVATNEWGSYFMIGSTFGDLISPPDTLFNDSNSPDMFIIQFDPD